MENILDTLHRRGFIEQTTDEVELRKLLEESQTVYCGFDPTADSLHLGNLVPIFALMHFQRAGHRVIAVIGGATGMIGDPSGKDAERSFLDEDTLEANLNAQKTQLERFLDFTGERVQPKALLANNADWTRDISLIEWLRGIGKQFTVNYMVAKESVRKRFEDRDQGISYTEFSYMLLQANDYDNLFRSHGCRLQVGGSDQWGNITAGIDLIRKRHGQAAHGITFPLLTTAAGAKFGKSEKGAVYLDPEKTSTWDLYQYFVRSDDRDVIRLLKLFTFLPLEEIAALEKEVEETPHLRAAQKRLAWEATALIHGRDEAERMRRGAEALYAGRLEELDADLIRQVFADGPTAEIERARLREGEPILALAAELGLVKSKGEARRMFKQGAIYLNGERAEEDRIVREEDILPSGTVIMRKGKKDYLVVRVV